GLREPPPFPTRRSSDLLGLPHLLERQHERDEGAGDGRGARAAIGLDDVAVEPDGALAELLEPHDGAERPADEPLDLLRPPADLPDRKSTRLNSSHVKIS